MITASPTDRYGRGNDKHNEYPDSPSVEGTFIGHHQGLWLRGNRRMEETMYLFRKIVPERLCTRIR